ncbi:energy-coupling factor transporter transmembrane component T [Ornithinibacillus halotolerans]|uniref:ABC transporter permease n=1 Tax=Ornithinibacillus halotolerans TaxID=1274357 RepID=A0A916SBL8_9BACI|nr:energy-coupling factor transporter transmembrane component T [Ornithinibacillus halotolerans]GGA92540.1 ABC transporter permease [Ornithinibacillus halotolerans]
MYFNHPLFLITALLILVFVNLSHDGGKALKKWVLVLILMSVLIILLNPFLVSRGTTILFYFRGKQVTLEATIYGMTMALFIVNVLILSISFHLILNGNRFLYIFSKFLPRTAFLVMMAIRFVPLLKRRLDEISDVHHIRGLSMREGNMKNRMTNGMLRLQTGLTWSLEEAIQTADSMKARGYGLGKKTSYIPYYMKKRDWVWLMILCFLFALCIAGGALGYGKIVIYPVLGTLQFFGIDWTVFGCMVLLMAFPLWVEGRETLRWRF